MRSPTDSREGKTISAADVARSGWQVRRLMSETQRRLVRHSALSRHANAGRGDCHGVHCMQEDSPDEIGHAVVGCLEVSG